MKTYHIEFAQGPVATFLSVLLITFLCLTVIFLPFGLTQVPFLYRIVEE